MRKEIEARGQVLVSAEAGQVWDLIADIEHWPRWNHDVRWARSGGTPAVGTEFKWKAGPSIVTSLMTIVTRPVEIAWRGKTLGIDAHHLWRLRAAGDETVVWTQEIWSGPLVTLLPGLTQKALNRAIERVLPLLKAEAERRKWT